MDKTTRDAATHGAAHLDEYLNKTPMPTVWDLRLRNAANVLKAIGETQPTTDADIVAAIDRFETAARLVGYETRSGGAAYAKPDDDACAEARAALDLAISLRDIGKPRKIAIVVSRDDGTPWGAIAVPQDMPETIESMVAVAAVMDLPKFCEVYGFFQPLQCGALPPDPIEAAARRLHDACRPPQLSHPVSFDQQPADVREHYRNLARIAREDME